MTAPPPGVAPRPPSASRVSSATVDVEDVDGVAVVRIGGKVDIYTVHRLRDDITRRVPRGTATILDLSAVEFLDSSGLGILIHLRNRAAAAGHRVGLVCDGRALVSVLGIAGLEDAFVCGADLDEVRVRLAAAHGAGPTGEVRPA